MGVSQHFATQIFQESLRVPRGYGDVAAFNRELLRECYQFSEHDREGQRWSREKYPGGYTSYGSMAQVHQLSSTFAALQTGLDACAKRFARSLEFEIEEGRALEMTSCWINIVPRYTYHGLHLHPISTLSGTYYVKAPARGGDIQFEDPRLACMMAAPPRRSKSFARFTPKAGQVILFESWLRHEVLQNLSAQDRVSISFNYNWF